MNIVMRQLQVDLEVLVSTTQNNSTKGIITSHHLIINAVHCKVSWIINLERIGKGGLEVQQILSERRGVGLYVSSWYKNEPQVTEHQRDLSMLNVSANLPHPLGKLFLVIVVVEVHFLKTP
ncbi:uncharacterized protein LOC126632275 [Malus sylvestris]|uniref:uncharacterized protein LOC126632275 n=1 Tax=Malus sylvestris TaxID=3752 RepID=UPI0021AC4567|nr:uncharacterized protein LOC126632275 [Malus sylvestris]